MPDIKPYTVVDPSVKFGPYSIVWHFTTVGYGTVIGEYVCIGSHCYIGNHCTIGDETRLQSGVFLPNHTVVGERVFIGPYACFTDDKHPGVRNAYVPEPPIIEDDVSIGAGAIILPGVRLKKGCFVGAGAVVTKDVDAGLTVIGTPAYEILNLANEYRNKGERFNGE